VLKTDGIHFASENNATVLRPLFDGLMKVFPVWFEEAGEEAIISLKMVEGWVKDLPVTIDSETVVFLPPHLLNCFSATLAWHILAITNRVFATVPVLKHNGGLIVFRLQKTGG
jgi:hypothetical protein